MRPDLSGYPLGTQDSSSVQPTTSVVGKIVQQYLNRFNGFQFRGVSPSFRKLPKKNHFSLTIPFIILIFIWYSNLFLLNIGGKQICNRAETLFPQIVSGITALNLRNLSDNFRLRETQQHVSPYIKKMKI